MKKPGFIARHSAHPRGLLGQLVARVMARETAPLNERAISMLGPKPGDQVLELGCGHGHSLARIAAEVGDGCVHGVDPSGVMLGMARRHNRAAIRRGRVRVVRGHSAAIPARSGSFDKAISVHTLYFWPDLLVGFREMARVLRHGGEVLLVFHSAENSEVAKTLPAHVYTLPMTSEVERSLRRAGFREIKTTIEPQTRVRFTRARI